MEKQNRQIYCHTRRFLCWICLAGLAMASSLWTIIHSSRYSSATRCEIFKVSATPSRRGRELRFSIYPITCLGNGSVVICDFQPVHIGVPSNREHSTVHVWSLLSRWFGWLCWGLTSQSTIFQSCRDGAIASWVINQYFRGVKCLAQGHNTAAVGLEPRTSRSGVRHSTTEPPRSPLSRWRIHVCSGWGKAFILKSSVLILDVLRYGWRSGSTDEMLSSVFVIATELGFLGRHSELNQQQIYSGNIFQLCHEGPLPGSVSTFSS